MRRWLPAPLLSAALIVMWLVLNRPLGLGQLLLALLFGVAAPALLAPLRPARPRIRRPWTVLRLILTVGRDVIASSLDVFWTLLRNHRSPVNSRFVVIPLELRDPSALASLTMITTVVPGTVWWWCRAPSGASWRATAAPCCCTCGTRPTRPSSSPSSSDAMNNR